MSKDKVVPPASEFCARVGCGHPYHDGQCTVAIDGDFMRCLCTSYVPPAPQGTIMEDLCGLHAAPPQAAPSLDSPGEGDPNWSHLCDEDAKKLQWAQFMCDTYTNHRTGQDSLASIEEMERAAESIREVLVHAGRKPHVDSTITAKLTVPSSEAEIPPATPEQAREAIAWRSGYEARKREEAAQPGDGADEAATRGMTEHELIAYRAGYKAGEASRSREDGQDIYQRGVEHGHREALKAFRRGIAVLHPEAITQPLIDAEQRILALFPTPPKEGGKA